MAKPIGAAGYYGAYYGRRVLGALVEEALRP